MSPAPDVEHVEYERHPRGCLAVIGLCIVIEAAIAAGLWWWLG